MLRYCEGNGSPSVREWVPVGVSSPAMLIKKVRVNHFRCVKSETLNCEPLTALVGANGSGKSTFLRALHLFYDASPKLDSRDCYGGDQSQPIEIAITFAELGPQEKERFSSYL